MRGKYEDKNHIGKPSGNPNSECDMRLIEGICPGKRAESNPRDGPDEFLSVA